MLCSGALTRALGRSGAYAPGYVVCWIVLLQVCMPLVHVCRSLAHGACLAIRLRSLHSLRVETGSGLGSPLVITILFRVLDLYILDKVHNLLPGLGREFF